MLTDIIEFKPGIGPLKLNVFALFQKLAAKPKSDSVAVVARRFLQIFKDHGVPTTQIPRLIPELTLDKLANPEILLPELNGEILEKAASLFKIRKAWLEGVGDQIYDTAWCYKSPERLFQELGSIEWSDVNYPIVALCNVEKLESRSSRDQFLMLALKEKACDLDEEPVYRYRIFEDDWNWNYWKCRYQLKAMARIVDKVFYQRIPIYKVDRKILEATLSGYHVPRQILRGRQLGSISLEDFALSPDESVQSKEAEELPQVMEYINYHKLEEAAQRFLGRKG